MQKISVESACSFAHSMDEELASPEQFFSATSQWLVDNQPVVARLSYEMGMRLCGDETPAKAVQAVVGYMLRLAEHTDANHQLECKWIGDQCPRDHSGSGEEGNGHRKYCCKHNA